jgi:hypothetical protein
MYTPSNFSLTHLRSAWRPLLLGVALLGPSCALAQTNKLSLPIERAIVSVTPAVASPDTPRTITVNGMWHDACVPGNPSIEPDPATNALVFKLFVPQTFVACAQVLTPYQAQQSYTPREAGVQRIVVLTNDGRLLGEGQMITQAPGKSHSSVNLTGEWHASDSVGSGLFLSHNFTGSDAILGRLVLLRRRGQRPLGQRPAGRLDEPDGVRGHAPGIPRGARQLWWRALVPAAFDVVLLRGRRAHRGREREPDQRRGPWAHGAGDPAAAAEHPVQVGDDADAVVAQGIRALTTGTIHTA